MKDPEVHFPSDDEEPRMRYDIRRHGEWTWEIYDTRSGRTAVIGGKERSGMPLDDADVECDFLNVMRVEPDEITLQ